MNVLAQASQTESKDIKLIGKKVRDSKSEEGKDFFENIISSIISESEEGEHKSFLLSKLLNLSSEFEKKEEVLSEFSDGALFTDHQIGKVSVQDLFKVAMMLKNGEDITTFPTDSKTLKLALLKPEVTEQLKESKNIKDLLAVAKKNNIEVKNFQFFKEEASLDPKDKKMVQKIKSEEIFKLIEKQIDVKDYRTSVVLNNPKEISKQNDTKTNILQTILTSKEISKPLENRIKNKEFKTVTKTVITESKELKTDTKAVAFENKELKTDTKAVITESKELKTDTKAVAFENKELKTDTKAVISEVKELKDSKNSSEQNKEGENRESENKKIVELKIPETAKQKAVKNNFQSTMILEKNNDSKEVQNTQVKIETSSEKVEVEKESNDKTAMNTEVKTQNIEKTKSTPDIKKTFNTFTQEFKEKVENYKPPLMKIKMELKPAGLGEVDVTLLTRGNNLQVNINSNSNTIAMFIQNQAEFKNSLVNMGFSDLQMNFSEQHKREQDSQNQKNGKNVFEQHEENEEQDGFEMIIPRYI